MNEGWKFICSKKMSTGGEIPNSNAPNTLAFPMEDLRQLPKQNLPYLHESTCNTHDTKLTENGDLFLPSYQVENGGVVLANFSLITSQQEAERESVDEGSKMHSVSSLFLESLQEGSNEVWKSSSRKQNSLCKHTIDANHDNMLNSADGYEKQLSKQDSQHLNGNFSCQDEDECIGNGELRSICIMADDIRRVNLSPVTSQQETETEVVNGDSKRLSGSSLLLEPLQQGSNEVWKSSSRKNNSLGKQATVANLDNMFSSADEDGNQLPKQDSQQLHGNLTCEDEDKCIRNGGLQKLHVRLTKSEFLKDETGIAFMPLGKSVIEETDSFNTPMGHANGEPLELSRKQSRILDNNTDISERIGIEREEAGIDLKFQDFHGLPVQEPIAKDNVSASLVSTCREGWQQFYEEYEDKSILGLYNGAQPFHQLELWEQLLDSELYAKEKNEESLPMGFGDVYVSLQDALTSPGNPFVDALDRSSNVSETDAFGSQQLGRLPFHLVEGSGCSREDFISGLNNETEVTQNQEAILAMIKSDIRLPLGDVTNCQIIDQAVENSQSFTDTTASHSQDHMEIFEAPSLTSIVDQATHELVEASMPKRGWSEQHVPFVSVTSVPTGFVGCDALKESPETIDHLQTTALEQIMHDRQMKWDLFKNSFQSPQGRLSLTLPSCAMDFSLPIGSPGSPYGGLQSSSTLPKPRHSLSPSSVPKSTTLLAWSMPSLSHSVKPTTTTLNKKVVQKMGRMPAATNRLATPKNAKGNRKLSSIFATFICCSSVR